MSWSVGQERVVACDWSNCRSSVFVALDSTNQIHVWDLMAIDSAPAVSCKLDDRYIVFAFKFYWHFQWYLLFAYYRALSLCIDQRSKKSTSLVSHTSLQCLLFRLHFSAEFVYSDLDTTFQIIAPCLRLQIVSVHTRRNETTGICNRG